MNILLNGEPRGGGGRHDRPRRCSTALDVPGGARGVAVAVDAEVVPRGEWDTTTLDDGARVEVLRAIQGG